MKKVVYFLVVSMALYGCKAFKPSADLDHFSTYFVGKNEKYTTANGQLNVTFFGTSTLLFDDGQTQIIVDGFFSRPKASKVIFGKLRSDKKLMSELVEKYDLQRLKGVFVCHSHYDHAMDAPLLSKQTGAVLYGSFSTLNLGKGEHLPDSAMRLYTIGEKTQIGNFTVTILNSKHTPPFKILGKSNATDPAHPDIEEPLHQPTKVKHYIEGGTYDVYIEYGAKRVLVKASTNYIPNALVDYPCDVLFLGTAMLGIMPDSFQQQYYKETVKTTGAKTVIPIHWDNFMKPLKNPLIPLPNISDNVGAGFEFLINKTKTDSVQFKLMQSKTSIEL